MLHNSTNTLSAGMVKDTSPLMQKQGTWTYALNAIMESRDGDFPFITTELGTSLSFLLPDADNNAILLGWVLTNTETYILFIKNDETSIIGEFDPRADTYTTIVDEPNLNFDSRYPIKALFRLRKGCERTIYFTDNKNPYRVINIDNLAQYGSPFDVDKLKLFRTFDNPSFTIQDVQDFGGNLPVGAYSFALQYMDEDLNETPWFEFTPTIPIVDEPLSSAYYEVDGGYNIIDPGQSTLGGVPVSNKSIVLQLDNLDQDFPFYRIAVMMSTAGTGKVSEVYTLTPAPITSPNQTFVFRNVDPSNATPSSLDEIQVAAFPIYRVGSHAQIDNRLILGNLSYEKFDWASVQIACQDITVKWRGTPVQKEDTQQASAKGPHYYDRFRSFMRDEVYALGVYALMDDGTYSPVFHIPGREILPDDEVLLTVGTDIPLEDVRHLGFDDIADDIGYGSGLVPTWLVYNTATNEINAYWESDIDYPDDEDCDGNRIYPTGKIRHHKLPDSRIAPIEDTDNIYPIAFEIDATAFYAAIPSEIAVRVKEWKFCRAIRNEADKTVLDKGYIITAQITEEDNLPQYGDNDRFGNYYFKSPVGWGDPEFDNSMHYYMSPKQMLTRPSYNTDFFTVERQHDVPFNGSSFVWKLYIDWDATTDNTDLYHRSIDAYKHIDRYKGIDGQEIASGEADYPSVRTTLNGVSVINNSYSTPTMVINISDHYSWEQADLSDTPKFSYVGLKSSNRSIYSNLSNIQYVDLIKKTVPVDHLYGGDCFIVRMDFKVSAQNDTWSFISAYYESEINAELRHEGLLDPITQSYFKGDIHNTSLGGDQKIVEYVKGYYEPDDTYYVRPEFLAYNPDYSKFSEERALSAIPFNYDWCSECWQEYPYRIIASEKSFQSEIADRYRTFRANNYTDFNGDCGYLEHLVTYNDQLYALTYNYPVFIPTRPQTIQTNQDVAYLGTGEIFSVPPKKLISTNYPTAGCQNWMSVINTDSGVYYADSDHGVMHKLGSPIETIQSGMNNWLLENLPFAIDEQFYRLFGIKYPWRYSTNGIGIHATYDPRYDRVIFTKNDYQIYNEETFGGILDFNDTSSVSNVLYWDETLGVFFIKLDGDTNQVVPLTNPLYFKNYSWTLSYSPRHQSWISFHSYLPYIYMNDGNDFFSIKQYSQRVEKHNSGNYTGYYNEAKKKHVIEFIVNDNPEVVKTFGSLELVCQSTLDGIDKDVIFDRGWFYNSHQSTGFKTLKLKTSAFQQDYTDSEIEIARVQRNWKLNNLRDFSTTDAVLYSSDWPLIRSDYFTDKVPTNLQTNLSQYQRRRMRDRWLACRLEFKPTANYKLTTNILQTQQNISYR